MQVPKPSPEAAEAEKRRLDLAARAGRGAGQLPAPAVPAGGHGRRWTICSAAACPRRRSAATVSAGRARAAARWPRTWRATASPQDQLVDAGLMRRDDETGRAFDLFFNRVMFPIRDRRGRAISFGGRIMGDGQPKYVNGPETALFSKRRTLYAWIWRARRCGGGATLVVVEGYMDVIALGQAGIGGAVAPLGTALTEEQLEELWRLSPAPILCFDGDAAGSRAAARAAELALPMLAPERTLRLVTLPSGRGSRTRWCAARGAGAFQAVLDGGRAAGRASVTTCCVRRAATRRPSSGRLSVTRLEAAAQRIPDRALAGEYRSVLLDRFFAARRDRGRSADGSGAGTIRCATRTGPGRRYRAPPSDPHPDRDPAAAPDPAARCRARLCRPRPPMRRSHAHECDCKSGRKLPKSLTLRL